MGRANRMIDGMLMQTILQIVASAQPLPGPSVRQALVPVQNNMIQET